MNSISLPFLKKGIRKRSMFKKRCGLSDALERTSYQKKFYFSLNGEVLYKYYK